MKSRRLRTGYTTGACAAAAAKAAAMLLLGAEAQKSESAEVEIPFPDGSRHAFSVFRSSLFTLHSSLIARASIIKDAGDDPDITNRAEIQADVRLIESAGKTVPWTPANGLLSVTIKGGEGVGLVTKPGLPTPVGEAAINPVPRKMIQDAVSEALRNGNGLMKLKNNLVDLQQRPGAEQILEVTIAVPEGKQLAKKTLNARLGIVGGISILGTTGIVRPISSEAWTATITASMDVAKAMGCTEIVISAGRSSEKAHMEKLRMPEEAYVMMGDYLEFSLLEAKRHGFRKIHLSAQWAKMLKIAMSTPQTHVRHGAIDIKKAVKFLEELWQISFSTGHEFNTAMEIFQFIRPSLISRHPTLFLKVCQAAKDYTEKITGGVPVTCYLVSYEGEVIAGSE